MKSFESIDDALDIESSIVKKDEPDETSLSEVITEEDMPDTQKDYEYTRANLYSLIEKGQEAVNGALELATEGDSARSYEVAGQLIKHVADVADKLMDLQKKVKDMEETAITNNNTNVTNNAVFVGSTSELQKMLKQGMLNNFTDRT